MALRTRIAFALEHLVGDGTSDSVELELTHAPFRVESFNPKFDATIYRPESIVVGRCYSSVTRDAPNDPKRALSIVEAGLLNSGKLGVKFSRALEADELVLLEGWLYFGIEWRSPRHAW